MASVRKISEQFGAFVVGPKARYAMEGGSLKDVPDGWDLIVPPSKWAYFVDSIPKAELNLDLFDYNKGGELTCEQTGEPIYVCPQYLEDYINKAPKDKKCYAIDYKTLSAYFN